MVARIVREPGLGLLNPSEVDWEDEDFDPEQTNDGKNRPGKEKEWR